MTRELGNVGPLVVKKHCKNIGLDSDNLTKGDLLRFAIERNPGGTAHVMIGDRKHDLVGALVNDMTPIGVAWGYGSVEELENAGAAAIANAPGELSEILETRTRPAA